MNDAGIASLCALRRQNGTSIWNLDYQTHAIQAAVDLFIGQPNQQTEFGLKAQNDMRFRGEFAVTNYDEQL